MQHGARQSFSFPTEFESSQRTEIGPLKRFLVMTADIQWGGNFAELFCCWRREFTLATVGCARGCKVVLGGRMEVCVLQKALGTVFSHESAHLSISIRSAMGEERGRMEIAQCVERMQVGWASPAHGAVMDLSG